MNNSINIRNAEISDSAEIANLMDELGYPCQISQIEKRINILGQSKSDKIFIAEIEGKVTGVLSFHIFTCFHVEGNVGRVTSLVVKNEYRRRGIGKTLMEAAEKHAWANNCLRIELTSGDHRPAAHTFYESIGYSLDARRFTKKRT